MIPMTSKPLVATLVAIVFVGSALSVGYTTGAFTDTEELEVTVAGNVSVDEYEGGPPNGDARGPPDDRGPYDADTESAASSTVTAGCGGDERLENGTTNGAAATTPNPCDGTRTETDPKTGSNESSGDENETEITSPKTDDGSGETDGGAVGSNDSDANATDAAENASVGLTDAPDSTPTNDTVSDTSNRTETADTVNSSASESDEVQTNTSHRAGDSTAGDSDGDGETALGNVTDGGNEGYSVGENESSDGTESSIGNVSSDENTSTSDTETSSASEDESGGTGTDSSAPIIAGEATGG